MNNSKILIADDVSESGLAPLSDAGFTLDRRVGLKPEQLIEIIADYEALIVRSETKVTSAILDAATRLRIIGRAGVGVDNIDVPSATARGVIVVNAPDGNTMTTAEHTVALLCALARKVPQAHADLRAGQWNKKKFVGVELRGKTLGIVGLGRIGRVVASRAQAFEMKVVAFDPFISPEQAQALNIVPGTLDEVFAQADFLTVHTPMTKETRGIIGREAFARMKQGVRVINCARGGLVDETALYEAIKEGKVAGAALDVFEQEPPAPDNPLLALDEVIITPHLGASTKEAQEGVAVTVAEEIRDYLQSGALRGAVNVPALGAQEMQTLKPYFGLAESLGRFQSQMLDAPPREVRIEYAGALAERDAAPLTRAFLAGLLRDISARVNVVNATLIAEERGISVTTSYKQIVREGRDEAHADIRTHLITADTTHTVAGTLFGHGEDNARIVEIDGFRLEAVPRGSMLVARNRDVPGVIGRIGTLLGNARVNISSFYLGRQAQGGEAIAVIELDAELDDATLEELRALDEVLSARRIKFD
ncbi:MAG: phosphoglycerate dehydrogenase [Pyrinomonadaceae bacterium MAG19_C2-C3]|nr:phosphoglycerate dehydrogenase [Pyrinomonadaceae bacterium MAG19_C2-C3]